ncbi:karyopherin [Hamiltosporidium tvaerminnensis]|uniref:Karyopherin n=1 Tax=Hamiltosporidium tvaerminnensis TaxID=1176355 RepID=A0A4Q9L7Z8_9MICR|nr:karyopherin Kap95 [Hamiltosporidium tvaerminnensis]TBU03797.1 karyopherin [Hamiltosporidium tvaerminnensis]
MNRNEMENLIRGVLSLNTEVRAISERKILEFQESDFYLYLEVLLQIFSDEYLGDDKIGLRTTAGIILRNSIHSADPLLQQKIESRYFSLSENEKINLKTQLIKSLNSSKISVSVCSGKIIAGIARIEVPKTPNSIFFEEIYKMLINSSNTNCTLGLLECIGTLCLFLSECSEFSFKPYAHSILKISIFKLETNEIFEIRTNSLKALGYSLEGISEIIKSENHINTLLLKIAAQCHDNNIKVTACALACMVKLVNLYYENIKFKIPEIILFLNNFLSSKDDEILYQILDFWSSLAEIEENKKEKFLDKYSVQIVPSCIEMLKKVNLDGSMWSVHKSAASCLQLISATISFDLLTVDDIQNCVLRYLSSEEIEEKEVGIVALGSLISPKGDTSKQFLSEVSDTVITYLPIEELTDVSLWCLARICEKNFDCIDPGAGLQNLVDSISNILLQQSKANINAAWVINYFSIYVSERRDKEWDFENVLTFFYDKLLGSLAFAAESVNTKNYTLTTALFTALAELINACAASSYGILDKFLDYLLNRVEKFIERSKNVTEDEFYFLEDFISNYIVLIQQIIIVRGEKSLGEFNNRILSVFIEILSIEKPTCCYGDVYMCLSQISTVVSFYTSNIPKILPFLCRDLTSEEDIILKPVVIYSGDIANITNQGFLVISNKIVPLLLNSLASSKVSSAVKPLILSVFGDVALAMSKSFEMYLDVTMSILEQILPLDRKIGESYVDSLRLSVIQLCTCILISLGDTPKLRSNLDNIIFLTKKVINEDVNRVCTKECVQILGDLVRMYGLKNELSENWVIDFISKSAVTDNKCLKKVCEKVYEIFSNSRQ